LYERITGDQGYFTSQIIFVQAEPGHKTTKLVRIDQDGQNFESLTDGRSLVLTPRYQDGDRHIAYISYPVLPTKQSGRGRKRSTKNPPVINEDKSLSAGTVQIYMMDLSKKSVVQMIDKNAIKKLLSKSNNTDGEYIQMTYAPRFSSDGLLAVLVLAVSGKSAIFKHDFAKNELIQLTKHSCIDTSPCFSPDDKKIVFTSNRGGRESLYTMNCDGSDVRHLEINGKCSQPVWSPTGDLIAFTKQYRGEFFICLVRPDGEDERVIARGYLVESPCWSSNGKYIIFSKKPDPGQNFRICMVDVTGRYERIVESTDMGTSPAWSALPVSLKKLS
jgi:TolB protein